MIDIKSLTNEAKQFIALKEQIKFLSDRQKEIKERLQTALQEDGEVDGRGHITLELDENIKITNQRRESRTLDENLAESMLKEKGIYDKCIKMVPTLQEDSIMASVYTGELTEQDIDLLFPAKVTYAFLL
jgi:hypothetical protein